MELRTHEKNIGQLKAGVDQFGEVWMHGSGDMFPVYVFNPNEPWNQDHSKNHAENFNRGFEENGYRVKINRTNMPKNKAELDRLLMQSKMQEEVLKKQATVNQSSRVTNVTVTDKHYSGDAAEPAGEIDWSHYTPKK